MKYKLYPDKITPLYVIISVLFVCFLMIANMVANRLVSVSGVTVSAAIFLFPITYIFGDILTEVYGFERSRLVIWLGMIANVLMSLYFFLVIQLPFPVGFDVRAYQVVLGATPLVVFASILAYFVGEFSNSTFMSIAKKRTSGKWLFLRTIGSTIVGEAFDTVIFILIAFSFLPKNVLLSMIVIQYLFKVIYEVVVTPITYLLINKIKKTENLDTFDFGVKYSPFSLKLRSL